MKFCCLEFKFFVPGPKKLVSGWLCCGMMPRKVRGTLVRVLSSTLLAKRLLLATHLGVKDSA